MDEKWKYEEDDRFSIPEEYLKMSIEELKREKEEIYRKIRKDKCNRQNIGMVKIMGNREKVLKEEMNSVKQLGERVGYGNLMSWASALWRKKLCDLGCPTDGAFVPRIDKTGYDEEIYDSWVEKFVD